MQYWHSHIFRNKGFFDIDDNCFIRPLEEEYPAKHLHLLEIFKVLPKSLENVIGQHSTCKLGVVRLFATRFSEQDANKYITVVQLVERVVLFSTT